MQRELISLYSVTRERIGARIVPDVAAIASVFSKLHVVAMRFATILEHKNQLVLTAIQRAHSSVVLGPDAQVLEFRVDFPSRGKQLTHVAPVHADEVQRAVSTVARMQNQRPREKAGQLRFAHLTRGHRELTVSDRAQSANLAVDGHVVRRIREHRLGLLGAQKRRVGERVERASAIDAVLAQKPQISRSCHRRSGRYFG